MMRSSPMIKGLHYGEEQQLNSTSSLQCPRALFSSLNDTESSVSRFLSLKGSGEIDKAHVLRYFGIIFGIIF
ncbi:hypothetical protein CDAR_33381 [Caerostris darwini]|uniref:Uncharacterized protein n=1 Tax=Caerostris darwini TaxID=1538125 RepID=A0AAV4VDA6_9ARAC|nr:hypothetical protein CDAR_33381 [Caerostris darwini]